VLDGGVDLVPVGHVSHEGRSLASDPPHLTGDLPHLRLVQIDDGDIGSVGREAERNAAPDSLPSSGDKNDLVLDAHGNSPFRC